MQTASYFVDESLNADNAIFDLTTPFYSAYENTLSNTVNDIAETNYAAQSAAIDNQAAQVRVQRVQQTANNASWENKLAQTIYHHQNSWWAKGILGFSDALNSDAGKWLLNSLHADAAMVENLNPFNAIATAATGFDALTHQSVTTVQAYEDFAASTVGLFSGEVADAALGYAGKMLPSLGRNWAGMFGDTEINALSPMRLRVMADLVGSRSISNTTRFSFFNNKATALNFYLRHSYDSDRAMMNLRGIDFSRDVDVTIIHKGDMGIQYYLPRSKEEEASILDGSAKEVHKGNYFAPVDTPASNLGIYSSGRIKIPFFVKCDTEVLKSTTSDMVDDYSMSNYGWQIETKGGATQYFSPFKNDWEPIL